MSTVRQHLDRPLLQVLTSQDVLNPTTSKKQWTEDYTCGAWISQPILRQTIELETNYGPLNEADTAREELPFDENQYRSLVTSEDDVRSYFAKFLDHPVQRPWHGQGVRIRNGAAPPATDFLPRAAMTVDIMIQLLGPGDPRTPMVIGELKKPRTIVADQWRGNPVVASQPTRKLAREMRALVIRAFTLCVSEANKIYRYAHQYNCHEAFVFDGLTYLGLRFCCNSRTEIKTCDMMAWVVPSTSVGPDVTVRRLLNFQVRSGYQRMRAREANDHNSIILNLRLLRRYWDGKVYWQDPRTQRTTWEHPDLDKSLDEDGDWVWEDTEEKVLHHELKAFIV